MTKPRAREQFTGKEIVDALQLLALVKARPAVKKQGDRATLIAYAELATLERWLLTAMHGQKVFTTHGDNSKCPQVQNGAWGYCKGHDSHAEKCEHGSDVAEVCRLCDPTVHIAPVGGWARPLGATPFREPHNVTEIRRDESYRCSCGSEFRTMNDAVDHAANARQNNV